MALANTYYPHMILFSAGSNTVHLTESSPSRGYQVIREANASEASSCFVAASESQPTLSFATTDIAEIVGLVESADGEEGVCCDLSSGSAVAYYRQGKPHGIRVATTSTSHIAVQFASSALLTINSLTAQQGQFASISGALTGGKSSGDPMVILGGEAVIAGACANLYKLGPVTINSVAVTGITGITLNAGVSLRPVLSDGESYPGFIGVDRVEPTMTITTLDMDELADATAGGNEVTELVFYLRRMSETGYQYADGTLNHIKCTISGGIKLVDTAGSSPVSTDVMVHIKKVGTDPVIEWAVDQMVT